MRFDKPLLCTILLAAFTGQCLADDAPLFRYEGKEYSVDDASPRLRRMLYDLDLQHFQHRRELAEEVLFEAWLESEAASRGTTPQALANELLATEPPSAQLVREFYDANAARIGQPFEAVKGRIAEHLQELSLRAKKTEMLAKVKAKGGFELSFSPPDSPPVAIDTLGYPHRGADSPRVKIVEFGDYQCSHCQRAAGVLQRMVEKYPEHVQVVYMDFPINRSGISRVVAEGAVCAQRQDRYWDYHDLAFEHQRGLDHESPAKLAGMLGLDEQAFAECMQSAAGKARVERSANEAQRLGLRATPSIFVNGQPLESGDLERDLERIIRVAIDA